MHIAKKIISIFLKTVASVVMIAITAIIITSVSLVYTFDHPSPFSGPDIFNPYRDLDTAYCWKRANFHTHTRVKSIFNECNYWPAEVYESLEKFGYDIITFSNHNRLTEHPFDPSLQVNVYEHGYNLMKFHKLVFGSERVNRFDNLMPIFAFQKQFQMDMLKRESDIIVFNHPLRTEGLTPGQMQKLSGYRIIELDSGKSTENEYWDWALSAGHYSFGLANDDLHYPDRSSRIAVRCSFLSTPSAEYKDIRKSLLEGSYYSMRVPDYGSGEWETKYAMNMELPSVMDIGMKGDTIFMSLSEIADSIKVTGQDHTTLEIVEHADHVEYEMKPDDPYARLTAYFGKGEVIYSNPFARYDASVSPGPYVEGTHSVNIFLTIMYNLLLTILTAGMVTLLIKTVKK